jgi:hypothetical protein
MESTRLQQFRKESVEFQAEPTPISIENFVGNSFHIQDDRASCTAMLAQIFEWNVGKMTFLQFGQ